MASRGTTLISDKLDFFVKTRIAEKKCLENVKNQLMVPLDSQAMGLTDPHRFAGGFTVHDACNFGSIEKLQNFNSPKVRPWKLETFKVDDFWPLLEG